MRRYLPRGLPGPLALALLAAVLASCSDLAGPGPQGGDGASIRVTANVSGTPISTLVVEVTAPDITTPLVFNLEAQNGVATGTIKVPPGQARTFAVKAFDSDGSVTHEGSATLDVGPGQNPPLSIVLTSKAGHVNVTVSFGASSVIVSPAADSMAPGETLQLTAYLVNTDGDTVPGDVEWATDNPARASVDASGLVTAIDTGTVKIYATHEGIAGFAQITITTDTVPPPPPPDSTGFTWTGAVSSDWSDGGNWSAGAVPGAADSAFVPAGTPNQPALTADAAIGRLYVASGATVSLGGFSLTVMQRIDADGEVTATIGRLVVAGLSATMEGNLARLRVTGVATMTGDVLATGEIRVDGGSIDNPGHFLDQTQTQ
jgi:hypothetical protein